VKYQMSEPNLCARLGKLENLASTRRAEAKSAFHLTHD